MTIEFWNQRYGSSDLAYGEAPNDFLVQMASRLPTRGRALDIGAGEGRNALFLASLGLDVLAVDQSEVGLAKAMTLAAARGLKLATQAADLNSFAPAPNSFDVISSIFVHLPAPLRAKVHASVASWLRPGGVLILEAYAPDQLTRDTGGPKDPSMLASLDTLINELGDLRIMHQAALVRKVVEGQFHTGEASVVQLAAMKP